MPHPTGSPLVLRRRGFTLLEMLVVIGMVLILLSIFIPYIGSIRESSRRTQCRDNLRLIYQGLSAYAQDNGYAFPRVVYDATSMPDGYTAYTGAGSPDPFAADSAVEANDVTASLWLLVRLGLVQPEAFICPSSGQEPDPLISNGRPVAATARSNFSGPGHLSYSYASPFSSAEGYRLSGDFLPGEFALMADMNPGVQGDDDAANGPAADAAPRDVARANSNNHGGAGQNVLLNTGTVKFVTTPYAGVEDDNIYTALAEKPLVPPNSPPPNGQGFVGRSYSPTWNGDSYLLPTDDETAPSP